MFQFLEYSIYIFGGRKSFELLERLSMTFTANVKRHIWPRDHLSRLFSRSPFVPCRFQREEERFYINEKRKVRTVFFLLLLGIKNCVLQGKAPLFHFLSKTVDSCWFYKKTSGRNGCKEVLSASLKLKFVQFFLSWFRRALQRLNNTNYFCCCFIFF